MKTGLVRRGLTWCYIVVTVPVFNGHVIVSTVQTRHREVHRSEAGPRGGDGGAPGGGIKRHPTQRCDCS